MHIWTSQEKMCLSLYSSAWEISGSLLLFVLLLLLLVDAVESSVETTLCCSLSDNDTKPSDGVFCVKNFEVHLKRKKDWRNWKLYNKNIHAITKKNPYTTTIQNIYYLVKAFEL